MDNQTSPEQRPQGHTVASSTPSQKPPDRRQKRTGQPFSLWRGLQTALGAAFIVATLFTLWTPGSLAADSRDALLAESLEAESAVDQVPIVTTLDATEVEPLTNVGIVAGHYGYDSGAVCDNGLREVDLNLDIATRVQKILVDAGYPVDLMEEYDPALNGYLGAVLVSIHLDSCAYINEQATGYKVAAALSELNLAASQRLTSCLSNRYGEVTGLPYHPGSVTSDMTYYHAFSEINPDTTAAIIEAGFMNLDQQFLLEQTDLVAQGIAKGILCFLNEEPILSTVEP
jgi:N-acetylmuramoyl-L-alanine amidase